MRVSSFTQCIYKMAGVKRKLSTESDAVHAHAHALHKELDEVSCPVCMDHPHNAVLLLCSSHDKGCRSYICDTSYRHSNCLDRFKKLHSESPLNDHAPEGANNGARNVHRVSGNQDSESMRRRRRRVGEEEEEQSEETTATANLKCPLCRGDVLGWKAVEEVRSYLDMKNRSCSRESCSFIGNYHDLRRHARRIHPATRPSDTDPTRERAWRRLENQREYGDIVSAIRSAMPGAVVVGDYVIENGDRFSGEREAGNGGGGGGSDLWTTLVLFQMIGSLEGNVGGSSGGGSGSVGGSRTHRSRAWRNHRRSSSDRRYLWGENLLGLQDEHNNDNDDDDDQELRLQNDTGDDLNHVPRRRRRFGRPRSSGNHPR